MTKFEIQIEGQRRAFSAAMAEYVAASKRVGDAQAAVVVARANLRESRNELRGAELNLRMKKITQRGRTFEAAIEKEPE